MFHLQDSQKEALANYQAITETWDTDQAVEILSRNNWDVTQASSEFFSGASSSSLSSIYNEDGAFHVPSPANPNVSTRKDSWEKKISSFFANIWKSIVPEEIRGEISKPAQEFAMKMLERCTAPVEFSQLKFQELLSFAHECEKLLFIYIHAFSEEYPRELFSDGRLVSLLNKEYVYWGVEASSEEGQLLKNLLKIELFPYNAVILVEDPKKPVVLEGHSGYLDKAEVIRILENHSKTEDQQLLQERRLREQQQEELKEAERLVVLREKEENEKIANEKRNLDLKNKAKVEKLSWLLGKIGDEPEIGDGVAQVSFKLPSGKRIDRRFHKSKEVQVLYDFLESMDIKALELVTGFPSKNLENKAKTLEDEGIYPKCVIHVREANN